jgi:hypothetical protein
MARRGLPEGAASAGRPARARAARTAGRLPGWYRWVLWALMLATVPAINAHVRSDGNAYYAYVRSLVIDHDLHFDNEYARAEPIFAQNMDGEFYTLPTGYRRNHMAVGASVLWSPFFLAAHAGVTLANMRGYDIPADGYSWPYLWACAFGTAVLTFLGLWWALQIAARFASPPAAFFAVILIWFASSLPVYLYFAPFHAHALATFTVAWFLRRWLHIHDGDTSARAWAIFGLSAGLMATTYYLNVLIGVVAAWAWMRQAVQSRAVKASFVAGALFAACFVLAALPNGVIKWIIEGSPVSTGYVGQIFFWNDPRLLPVAFAQEHGVFLWTPILLLAFAGIFIAARRQPAIGIPLVLAAVAMYYGTAAYRNWHGHSSYGNRFLTALTPIYVVGLAALVDALIGRATRNKWMAAWAIGLAFVLWNAGLMLQWGTNIIPNRGPVDFRQAVKNQFTVVPKAAFDFASRYFSNRASLVKDLEQQDLKEVPKFEIKR